MFDYAPVLSMCHTDGRKTFPISLILSKDNFIKQQIEKYSIEMPLQQWEGLKKFKELGISKDDALDVGVFLLPENYEIEEKEKFFESVDTIGLYKEFKAQSIDIKGLIDFGIDDIPIYDRRSGDIWLGLLVIQNVVLPIATNLLASYIFDKFRTSKIHLKMRILDGENLQIKLDYEGDRATLNQILKIFSEMKKNK